MTAFSTAAVIRRGDRILLLRRKPGGALSGKWELPGGKVDPGETHRDALARELAEELRVSAAVGELVATASFSNGETDYTLEGYLVECDCSRIELLEHVSLQWCRLETALEHDLAPSDRSLLRQLLDSPYRDRFR